jgi:subtilase family serine protease
MMHRSVLSEAVRAPTLPRARVAAALTILLLLTCAAGLAPGVAAVPLFQGTANLTVVRVWAPDNPSDASVLLAGHESRVCTEVMNQGTGPAQGVGLIFEADGSREALNFVGLGVGDIAAGESAEPCRTMTIPAEARVFSAIVSPADQAQEAQPSDNRLDVALPLADVRVAAVSAPDNPLNTSQLPVGQETRVCVLLENLGAGVAPSVSILYEADGSREAMDFLGSGLGNIGAGQDHETCRSLTIPAGTSVFSVQADLATASAEANAADNRKDVNVAASAPTAQVNLRMLGVEPADDPGNPDALIPGQGVNVCAYVRNEGPDPARLVQLRFSVDGPNGPNARGLYGVGDVPNGAAVGFCRETTIPADATIFTAYVYPANQNEETDDSDNHLDVALSAADQLTPPGGGLADLRVASVGVDGAACEPGRNRIEATILNDGAARARDVQVRLFVDGQELDTSSIGEVEPSDDKRVRFDRTELTAGSHSVRVVVDPTQAVSESNEGNNDVSQSISCQAPLPDLQITSLELDDDDCEPGRNDFKAEVKNAGVGRANRSDVRLWVDGQERDTDTVDDLDPGDEKRVRFSNVTLSAGQHQIRVRADASGQIDEGNESNNERTISVSCGRRALP